MFRSARLKLTLYYLIIIMLVSFSFSLFIYRVLIGEVQRLAIAQETRIQRQLYTNEFLPPNYRIPIKLPPDFDLDLVQESQHRLVMILVMINASIFVLAGGGGYLLAGLTLKPIQDMLVEQNRFISDSSHEFRTPLTSLKTAMEVSLRDKQLKLSEAKNILAESIDEVNKLQALSDGLLQLAQYQKPHQKTNFSNVSFTKIIDSSTRQINPLAKAKNIQLQIQSDAVQLEANEYGLQDLLIILLDNAIKYSPENKQIFLVTKKRDHTLQIMVQDQGIGVDEKDIPHLFDRFYRADGARSKAGVGGYGLGLSIAKQIVESHHGNISIKRNQNEGATFIVQLPLKQPRLTRPKFFS